MACFFFLSIALSCRDEKSKLCSADKYDFSCFFHEFFVRYFRSPLGVFGMIPHRQLSSVAVSVSHARSTTHFSFRTHVASSEVLSHCFFSTFNFAQTKIVFSSIHIFSFQKKYLFSPLKCMIKGPFDCSTVQIFNRKRQNHFRFISSSLYLRVVSQFAMILRFVCVRL